MEKTTIDSYNSMAVQHDDLHLSLNEQAFHDTITSLKSFAGYVLPTDVRRNIIRTYWRYFNIRQLEKNLDEQSKSAYNNYLKRIGELSTRIRYGGEHANSPRRMYDLDVFCRHPNDSGYERVVYDRNTDGTRTYYYKPVLSADRRTAVGPGLEVLLEGKQDIRSTAETNREITILGKRSRDMSRRDMSLAVDHLSDNNQKRYRRDDRNTATSVGVVAGEESSYTFCNEPFPDWIDSSPSSNTPGISRTSYDISIVKEASNFGSVTGPTRTADNVPSMSCVRVERSELQRLLEAGTRDDERLRQAAKESRRRINSQPK